MARNQFEGWDDEDLEAMMDMADTWIEEHDRDDEHWSAVRMIERRVDHERERRAAEKRERLWLIDNYRSALSGASYDPGQEAGEWVQRAGKALGFGPDTGEIVEVKP